MKVKAIINKSGSGSVNVRIPLPANIAKELNINSNNREVNIEVIDNKIIITKIILLLMKVNTLTSFLIFSINCYNI